MRRPCVGGAVEGQDFRSLKRNEGKDGRVGWVEGRKVTGWKGGREEGGREERLTAAALGTLYARGAVADI